MRYRIGRIDRFDDLIFYHEIRFLRFVELNFTEKRLFSFCPVLTIIFEYFESLMIERNCEIFVFEYGFLV